MLLRTILVALVIANALPGGAEEIVDGYVQRYLETFPSFAVAAGDHRFDSLLEDLSPDERKRWIDFNRATLRKLASLPPADSPDARLDRERIARQAELELLRWETLRVPERDPLFWSGLLAGANVYLLVRDDLPESERMTAAASRAAQLPRLARQAREALATTPPDRISPELARMAAGQLESLARFYREGFARVRETSSARLEASGRRAADALQTLASYLAELAERASGSPRTGPELYEELFLLYTGLDSESSAVLAEAESDLHAKRAEAAGYGRSEWPRLRGDEPAPEDDRELLRALFRHIEGDIAESVDAFIEDYRQLSEQSIRFVRDRQVVTIPEPLEIWIGRSPDYFAGQSVGGVYPAGPFAPEAATLLFLPTPPSDATPEQQRALFRAFNHPFNTMITPHELVPGHTLQLVSAARHPSKVRSLFPDDVYVEGWGTFCERLMLDLGWGGPEARLAHLKKQLENIARAIVDIRVHTTGITEEEVLRFVRDEALQDEQFARNMWRRTLTSSPQLTTYHLGYLQVRGLYDDVRASRGESFDLRTFMDGMMELGPVPVSEYRRRMLPSPGP